jgi:hypothetical protein
MRDTTKSQVIVDDPFYSEEEAGAFLGGISPRTFQRWRQTGEGPAFTKLGRLVRYRRSALLAYADARCRNSTSDAQAA